MKYQILGYDYSMKRFKSHSGFEPDVCLQPEASCGYYLYRGSHGAFIVKLAEEWKDINDNIGEILTLKGTVLERIPHPGKEHGTIMTNGLVSGGEHDFKFIVTPKSGDQYFLVYSIIGKSFSEAGSAIR